MGGIMYKSRLLLFAGALNALTMLVVEKGRIYAQPEQEGVYRFERQQVVIEDFEAEGYILAVGGGGEGIVGRLKGSQVVAIDIRKRELDEAPPGPLKVVMDARELKFVDKSFETAAIFFTMMYIDGADHLKVLQEVNRVLTPGGRVLIWDAVFGPRPSEDTIAGRVPLVIKLPEQEVETYYGVRWPSEPHDLDYYKRLGEETGFEIGENRLVDKWFFLELKKPIP
jgi:SAM-dependent methyltransferase